jgi:hypothetical protein
MNTFHCGRAAEGLSEGRGADFCGFGRDGRASRLKRVWAVALVLIDQGFDFLMRVGA